MPFTELFLLYVSSMDNSGCLMEIFSNRGMEPGTGISFLIPITFSKKT